MPFLEIEVVDPSTMSEELRVCSPVVREIIRKCEPDPARRPTIHVGG